MYTLNQLKEDVRKEAEALKVHATKEELGRLDFERLAPEYTTRCIYGLMAKDCNSDRAAELILACAHRYIADANLTDINRDGFERIKENVNGAKVEDFVNERTGSWAPTHYSAIEAYILLPEAKNANLIAYLKGESETLEL